MCFGVVVVVPKFQDDYDNHNEQNRYRNLCLGVPTRPIRDQETGLVVPISGPAARRALQRRVSPAKASCKPPFGSKI